ncbi:protein of unknown function (plasmid) [Caballeronia sp. S22]
MRTTTETWGDSFLDAVKSISLNAPSHESFLSVTLIALRQELSRLHAGLFDVYMATRSVRHR